MNGYPNGLSMAIRIVYQPPSMWIINYFPSESSMPIKEDLSATIMWIIDLYQNDL